MARSTARKRALNTWYEVDEKGQDIRGVAEHRRDIDAQLDECSTGWKISRMGVVDRNILRIAAWEIMYNDEVPDKVAIDEALGLAKTLCDGESPAFIHGLLSAVCTAHEKPLD